jgi:hypothetical protein
MPHCLRPLKIASELPTSVEWPRTTHFNTSWQLGYRYLDSMHYTTNMGVPHTYTKNWSWIFWTSLAGIRVTEGLLPKGTSGMKLPPPPLPTTALSLSRWCREEVPASSLYPCVSWTWNIWRWSPRTKNRVDKYLPSHTSSSRYPILPTKTLSVPTQEYYLS